MDREQEFAFDLACYRAERKWWASQVSEDKYAKGDEMGIGRIYAMLGRILLRG